MNLKRFIADNGGYIENFNKKLILISKCGNVKNKHPENTEKNPLNELDKIKLKGFKELEHQYFSDIKLEDFQKERLKEFDDVELKAFNEFVEDLKTDISIENLKLELNSKDTIKNIMNELKDIGINGKTPLKLLKTLKREIQK